MCKPKALVLRARHVTKVHNDNRNETSTDRRNDTTQPHRATGPTKYNVDYRQNNIYKKILQ